VEALSFSKCIAWLKVLFWDITLYHWVIDSKEYIAFKMLRIEYPMMQHHIPEHESSPIACTSFHITHVFEFVKLHLVLELELEFI
jgi:hypothetical protein